MHLVDAIFAISLEWGLGHSFYPDSFFLAVLVVANLAAAVHALFETGSLCDPSFPDRPGMCNDLHTWGSFETMFARVDPHIPDCSPG